MKNFLAVLFLLFISFSYDAFCTDTTCVGIVTIGRSSRPVLANSIGTTHFIVHWESPTTQQYAQNAATYAEYAWQREFTEKNWLIPPGDNNRGGDNRYDIYILPQLDALGLTIAEIEENWPYEWAPSYIEIINTLDDNNEKMTIAHEVNHASQFAYTYKDIYLSDGTTIDPWFYENTAVWMAEEVYNYQYQYYQRYFGFDPLSAPQFGVHTVEPFIGYFNYAGFLWPKFLAEWTNNSDIVRLIWYRMRTHFGEHILDDINFMLSGGLNNAVRYYAEWRYYTGERADNFHFSIAADLPTASTVIPVGNKLRGYGGTCFIEINYPYEIVNVGFNGEDNFPWLAEVVEDRSNIYPPIVPVNKKINLDSYYDGSIDAVSVYDDGENINQLTVILMPILNTLETKKSFTYSATPYTGRELFFFNKIAPNNAGGSFKLDNNSEDIIPSGEQRWLRYNSTQHNIFTLNERFSGTPTYKHNNWNDNLSNFYLNKNFTVQNTNNTHNANFIPLNYAKVEIRPEGFLVDQKGAGKFQDPWYVLSDGSQPGNYWKDFNSYYEPTGKEGASGKGVFLNQTPDPNNPDKPYYSVQAISPQQIPLGGLIGTRNFYFQNWGGTNVSFNHSSETTTGVVFTNSTPGETPVAKADFKGQGFSNDQNGYSSSSQRKFVRTENGYLHSVYESMGNVWYEISTDNGSNWKIANGAQPIAENAKNPSIDYYGNFTIISYQNNVLPTQSNVWITSCHQSGNDYFPVSTIIAVSEQNQWDYNSDANPVISINYNADFLLCWQLPSLSPLGDLGLYCRFGYINSQDGTLHWADNFYAEYIPLTDMYSIKPTITSYKYGNTHYAYPPQDFFIAWEQNHLAIKYLSTTYGNGHMVFSAVETPSNGSGYSNHYQPCLAVSKHSIIEGQYDYYIRLSWLGYRRSYPSDRGELQPFGEQRVLLRSKVNSLGWWGVYVYGDNTQSVSINSGTDMVDALDYLAIAWSELYNNSFTNKYFRSHEMPYIIRTLSTNGKDIQINNGTNLSNMYVNSFSNSSIPYYFALSEDLSGSNGMQKIETTNILKGREGIVNKDSTDFYYAFGDIFLDGQGIDFVNIPDTIISNNLQTINEFLISKPFSVTDNSSLIYGVQYGITDSAAAVLALSDSSEIGFKIELVDVQSGEILGIFDDITYTSGNVFQYNNIGYEVDLSGIGNKTVRLRLVINSTNSCNYFVSQRFSDYEILYKRNHKKIDYIGLLSVNTYNLSQNYPNPFNPATTINYQVPENSFVTLKVYDILGREVATLVNEQKTQGKYSVKFEASKLASGIYIYQIKANDFVSSKKMILLK